MSTELVWVAPEDRAMALGKYRLMLASRGLDDVTAALRKLAAAFEPVWEAVKRAVTQIFETFEPLIRRMYSRSVKYADCQAHYGTRRVTARQYRAWKRQVGRR